MSSDTKLIVITSNDDLIQKISSSQWSKTNIIDLDDISSTSLQLKQTNGTIAQISPSDLNIFFELSQLNNQNNDEVYHDQLNSSRNLRSKSLKMTRKSTNNQCVICDDKAIGYNYDVLSCASCKAFFRRNAHHSIENLRCLTGRNDCSIRSSDRRKCQRCRLDKCFQQGMRKDFILSEEEKQRRKQKSQSNQLTTNAIGSSQLENSPEQDLMDLNESTKSFENWIELEILRSSYSTIFTSDDICNEKMNLTDRLSAIASWSEMASQTANKLIDYFRQIDQFEYLNGDDRFFLIKSHLFPIFFVHKSFRFNCQTNSFIDMTDEDRLRRQQFFNLCYGKSGIKDEFLSLIRKLSEITERDVTLTCLLLVVLLFSKGLSMIDDEGILKEPLVVYQYQNHFIELTMNYLIEQKGYDQSIKQITQILLVISQIQQLTRRLRQFFHSQLKSEEVLQRIAPLMKSFLNIS